VLRGDQAHEALRPRDALALFEEALSEDPDNFAALWKASREAVNLGMLASDDEERKALNEKAVRYARRAREVDAGNPRAGEWLSIALGRQALDEGPRSRVRLAQEIREVALETLALDSLNAGAHHVLGEWNAEIRRLSGVERWFARKLLGGDVFKEASWQSAEFHLRRAVELDPGGLVHHLALARVYLDTGREEEARAQLREVLERPAMEPVDPLYKQEAHDLLSGG
jgi:tetratricopeptide (TPR) repeat protein